MSLEGLLVRFFGYGGKLAIHFQPWEHYGAAVSGGIDTTALTATLGFEEGCAILALVRRAQRQHLPPRVSASASRKRPLSGALKLVRSRTSETAVCASWGSRDEVVNSSRGGQRGCNLGPICYSVVATRDIEEFKSQPPVPRARVVSFIDITVILPLEISLDIAVRAAEVRTHLPKPEQVTSASGEWSPTRRRRGRTACSDG